MVGFKVTMYLDDVTPETIRQIIVPSDITFKKMHEIIALMFNMNSNERYKFNIYELKLEIKDTGKLNRDIIDSRYEKIDKYFQAFKVIYYQNNFWNVILKIEQLQYEKSYPVITEISNYFNPQPAIISSDEFSELIKFKNENRNELVKLKKDLRKTSKTEIQEKLMVLFNVPYEKNQYTIKEIQKHETLENYF